MAKTWSHIEAAATGLLILALPAFALLWLFQPDFLVATSKTTTEEAVLQEGRPVEDEPVEEVESPSAWHAILLLSHVALWFGIFLQSPRWHADEADDRPC